MSSPTIDRETDHETRSDAATLLDGIVRRDPAAWAEVLRRYGPLVAGRARAYRLQDADIHDVMQVVWVKLGEHAHTIQDPERLGGWLLTTVTRECWHLLDRSRRTGSADPTLDRPDPAAGPEQRVLDGDTATILRATVAELSPRARVLLAALFDDEPQPYAELACRLGMPVGSIGPTRARQLRHLRKLLALRGISFPT